MIPGGRRAGLGSRSLTWPQMMLFALMLLTWPLSLVAVAVCDLKRREK